MSSYLAPTYFPPSYFGMGGTGGSGSVGTATVRDRDVYRWMMEEVKSTGEFSEVVYLLPGLSLESADRNPILGVMPKGWEEVERGEGGGLLRSVRYQLWIVVRDAEPETRYDWGDRLANLVQNRLDGSSLGGVCLAALSVLRRGTIPAASDSNVMTMVLEGSFVYGIDPSLLRGTMV